MNEVVKNQYFARTGDKTCAEQIALFIAQSSKTHPENIRQAARRAFADTLGCMYLGSRHPDTMTILSTVQPWGQGDKPVFGHEIRLPAPWAALVNGTSAHAYDFDDWEDPGISHGSAAIFPALLALADDDTSLESIEDAWIIGTEVIMRIGQAVNMTHYELGWHTTNTIGALGAAAACARLMSLDASKACHAISLSTSMIGGFTLQFGTTAKPMHAGLASKTGVMSASLAARNATAQKAVFEEDAGFLSAMTHATPAQLQEALTELGKNYAIAQFGLHIKKYPSCGGTHLVIEACQKIREKHQVSSADIASVDTSISDIAYSILPYRVPNNRTEALFSVPWCAAVALVDGDVGVPSFQPEALARPNLLDLSARISVNEHPRSPGVAFHPDFPDVVTVRLKDGQSFTETVSYPLGSPPRPLATSDLRSKFLENMKLGKAPADAAHSMFENIFESPQRVTARDFVVSCS